MERMNVETQEEIDAIIKKDMEDFVAYTEAKMDESIDNYYEFYTSFESWFDTFFASYTKNLQKLGELNREFLEMLDIEDYLDGNGMNIEGGLGTLGTLSAKDRADIYSRVDLSPDKDYSRDMDEAIARGDFEAAQDAALLREAKAELQGITLGQGKYRTNQQVWDDSMKKHYGDAADEISAQILSTNKNIDRNAQYNLQNGVSINKGNALTQAQTTQLNNTLVENEVAIEEGASLLNTTIQKGFDSATTAIKQIPDNMLNGSEMTPEEIEEALANGQAVDMGNYTTYDGKEGTLYLDPDKKAPVYDSVDEDSGVIGSAAWFDEVRNSPNWSDEDINNVVAQAVAGDVEREATREITSMKRNKHFAGQEVTVGGVTVRYDDMGYAVAQVKNERHVDDDGNIYYTSASGERREVTDLSDYVNTDLISSNVKNVADALDTMGYGINSVVCNVITTIAAKSNEEISASQAQLLAEQAIASGISTSSASLIGVSNVGNDLVSGISTSFEEALEYLKSIDDNTVASINESYGDSSGSGGSSSSGKYKGTSDYGFGDSKTSSSNSSINLNENYTALANKAYDEGRFDEAEKYAEKANAKVQSSDYTGSIAEVKFNKETGKYEGIKKTGYSDGLKSGPVTYTGLAMLHGTPQEPEYVLNNDQAYNLLYNLSAARNAKMAEFDRVKSSNNGIQYVVQGDIILEGVDDPAEFWQEVTNAMGNRWNVTKNR